MVPKSKTNKVRTVLEKGGQSVFGMHSCPDFCIRALHFRNCKEYHPSSTGLAVPLDPCCSMHIIRISSFEVTCANIMSLVGKAGAAPAEANAPSHQEAKTPNQDGGWGQSNEGVSLLHAEAIKLPAVKAAHLLFGKKLVHPGMGNASNFPNTY